MDHQHTTGYWLHHQLRTHRARTRRPEKAHIIVVPLWLQLSWQLGSCNGTSHLERVSHSMRALNATAIFQRFATRHLLAASTFMMREPPHSRLLARRQRHDVRDADVGCYNAWSGFQGRYHFFPKDPALEKLLDFLTMAHMERTPRHPADLCRVTLPGSPTRMYDQWPPQWWQRPTLVLPYVVDARTTALARASATTSFDYAQWLRRPQSVFFVGNCVRKRGAGYVRLGLTQLNDAWADSRVHCSGVGVEGETTWNAWLAATEEYLNATARSAKRHSTRNAISSPLDAALRGKLGMSPLPPAEVATAMANSKFCLTPRGDSPSSGRIFYAIALGCMPIVVADPWLSMAEPFDGLLDYAQFALFVAEADAITTPTSSLAARFEELGGTRVKTAGEWTKYTPMHKAKVRWHFPDAGTTAAERLATRLEAMQQAYLATLWQHPRNELIANLTLESARRVIARGGSGMVAKARDAHELQDAPPRRTSQTSDPDTPARTRTSSHTHEHPRTKTEHRANALNGLTGGFSMKRSAKCEAWCRTHSAPWARKCSIFANCQGCHACVATEADNYFAYARAKMANLASTCDPPTVWNATLTVPRVHIVRDGVVAIHVAVSGFVGHARVTLRPAPADSWAERKPMLLDVTPRKMLPRCLQDIFGATEHIFGAAEDTLRTCPMERGRMLRSRLAAPSPSMSECMRPMLEDVASASLALVVTWSSAGFAASVGYRELHALDLMVFNRQAVLGKVRAVLFGKGSRCLDRDRMPLSRSVSLGHAHCIEGPNTGARESHTIWSFCYEFHRHLPRNVLFVQDDPQLGTILRDLALPNWPSLLEESYASRKQPLTSPGVALTPPGELWRPSPCFCAPVRERLDASHTYLRSMTWWMRTFLSPYNRSSAALPEQILWPATAQFMLPRVAIADRPRESFALQVQLTEVPAPLRTNVERKSGASDAAHAIAARNANFGQTIVDLGEQDATRSTEDKVGRLSGMGFAQLFERTWFTAFDPATPAAAPAHPECYQRKALVQSPVRCAASACLGQHYDGGCAATDTLGGTVPPRGWMFEPRLALKRAKFGGPNLRCVGGSSCHAEHTYGSTAWVKQVVS